MVTDKSLYKKAPKKVYGDQNIKLPSSVQSVDGSLAYNNAQIDSNQTKTDTTKAGLEATGDAVSAIPVVGTVIGAAIKAANATDSIGRSIPGAVDERGYASDSNAGTLGKMASPVEGIKNIGSGNNADTMDGLSTFLTGGSSTLFKKISGNQVDPIFGKNSAQKAKDDYDEQKRNYDRQLAFAKTKGLDNVAERHKSLNPNTRQTWGTQNNYIMQSGTNKTKTGLIEIEGKKAPEIHTNEQMDTVKNLGTLPHKIGGNKVIAQEGDVVFNTQNSPAKYKRIMGAIAAGDKKTLEKERMKIPGGSSNKKLYGDKDVDLTKSPVIPNIDASYPEQDNTTTELPQEKFVPKKKRDMSKINDIASRVSLYGAPIYNLAKANQRQDVGDAPIERHTTVAPFIDNSASLYKNAADAYTANKKLSGEYSGGNVANARENTKAANIQRMEQEDKINTLSNERFQEYQDKQAAAKTQDDYANAQLRDSFNERKRAVRTASGNAITEAMSQIGEINAYNIERKDKKNFEDKYLETQKELYNPNRATQNYLGSVAPVQEVKTVKKKVGKYKMKK